MDPRRATVFGEVAETYDRMRPSYPDEMFEDLFETAGIGPGSTVLESGCGTGIATAALVERGLRVTAMDPDPRMLEVARRRLGGSDVRFVEGRFEEAPDLGPFDLVFAASSWHWVDPEAGFARAAELLETRGALAVCWNLARPQESDLPEGIEAAYRAHAPELAEKASQRRDVSAESRRKRIAESSLFEEPVAFSYRSSRSLGAQEYCDLLSTHSDHVILGPDRLARLLDAVRQAVEEAGGTLELQYETVMYVARVA